MSVKVNERRKNAHQGEQLNVRTVNFVRTLYDLREDKKWKNFCKQL